MGYNSCLQDLHETVCIVEVIQRHIIFTGASYSSVLSVKHLIQVDLELKGANNLISIIFKACLCIVIAIDLGSTRLMNKSLPQV